MALLDRVTGYSGDKISPHALYGMMRELARGVIDKQYMIDNLDLDAGDETDLDWLIAQYQSRPTAEAKELFLQGLWGIILISEIGFPGYENQAEVVAKITSL